MCSKPVKVVVAGGGDHFKRGHFDHFGSCLELVGVFDINPDKIIERYGEGVKIYKSFDACLTDETVEAVMVMTPDSFHLHQAELAIKAGKHVFVEKPIITSILEAVRLEELMELAVSKELVLLTCHPRRTDPPYVWLKETMLRLEEYLGKPVSLRLSFSYHRASKEGLHDGLLIDHLPHEVDTMRQLFGPREIEITPLYDREEVYAAHGIDETGMTFLFEGSRTLPESRFEEDAGIIFDNGSLHINTFSGDGMISIGNQRSPITCGKTEYDVRSAQINKNFAHVIRGTTTPYLTSDDILINNLLPAKLSSNLKKRDYSTVSTM